MFCDKTAASASLSVTSHDAQIGILGMNLCPRRKKKTTTRSDLQFTSNFLAFLVT